MAKTENYVCVGFKPLRDNEGNIFKNPTEVQIGEVQVNLTAQRLLSLLGFSGSSGDLLNAPPPPPRFTVVKN